MIAAILVLLIILWALGYVNISALPIPNVELFVLNGHPITLWNLLTVFVITWLIGILPRPFREIAIVLFILWLLSIIGVLAIAGLSNLLLIAIILGVIFYMVGGKSHA